MSQFLSPHWMDEFDRALTMASAQLGHGPDVTVQQVVTRSQGGDTCFVIDVGSHHAGAHLGSTDTYTVSLTEDYSVAAALSGGALSAPMAIVSGRVRIKGDPRALAHLSELLESAGDRLANLRAHTTY